jgi:serine/threonine protein kinase
MKDTQAELFQQIRACEWKFHKKDWEHISSDAKDLIKHLLVADPVQRWTAEEALKCAWIQNAGTESNPVDLTASIESLRERRARLRQFATPVVWKGNETDSFPVDAALQMQDAVAEEGSTTSLSVSSDS